MMGWMGGYGFSQQIALAEWRGKRDSEAVNEEREQRLTNTAERSQQDEFGVKI